MEKITNSRELLYIGGVSFFPAAILFKGMFLLYLATLGVCLLLIKFDPLFKKFIVQVEGAKYFIYVSLTLGGIFASISLLYPEYKTVIVLVWFASFVIHGVIIADRMDFMDDDIT